MFYATLSLSKIHVFSVNNFYMPSIFCTPHLGDLAISYGHGSMATSHCLSLALMITCPAISLELMSQVDKNIAGGKQRAAILALSSGLYSGIKY